MTGKRTKIRDISGLYDGSKCLCCEETPPITRHDVIQWIQGHVDRHLADGTAVVVIDTGSQTECVVPTNTIPDEPEPKPKRPVAQAPKVPKGFKVWTPF